jgi:hypothetical protein
MKCASAGADLTAVFTRRDEKWYLVEAIVNDGGEATPGHLSVDGTFLLDPEYGGCPTCGLESFFKCSCGNLMCFVGGAAHYRCAWCGETGTSSPGVRTVKAADTAG